MLKMIIAALTIAGVFLGAMHGNIGMVGFALTTMIYTINDLKD